MIASQNGWQVLDSAPAATIPEFITGRVRGSNGSDVDVLLTYLCDRFDKEVENIRPEWSWGWAKRPIRGSTTTASNHASATAVDLNAPVHPLGRQGTFSAKQVQRIRQILRDIDAIAGDVIRWGGDYAGRKDEMHFEIVGGPAKVKKVADAIRAGKIAGLTPPWKPNYSIKSDFGPVKRQIDIASGELEGLTVRYHGVGFLQNALNVKTGANLKVDGFAGKATVRAMRAAGLGSTLEKGDLEKLQIAYRYKF